MTPKGFASHYRKYRGGSFLSSWDATCEKCGNWLLFDERGVIYCAYCGCDHRPKL